MEKRSPIFKVLLVIGLAANVVVLGMIFSEGKAPVTAEDAWEKYTSDFSGYSVVYPASWRRTATGDARIAEEMTFHCSRHSRIVVFASSRTSLSAEMFRRETMQPVIRDLPSIHRESLIGLEKDIDNMRATQAANMLISGSPDYALVTTFEGDRDRESRRPVKGILVSAWNNDYYISFRLSSLPEEFDQMQEAFGNFLQQARVGLDMKEPN